MDSDESCEWWENFEEAKKRFGEWKEPTMVLYNHIIRSFPEPRKKWCKKPPIKKYE